MNAPGNADPLALGVALRSMGNQSRGPVIQACARAAEEHGLAEIWVQDHLAIPPDDAEGSGGRYLDPLTTLAWLAASTRHIGLGTGVLNLPYRPPLPTAKAIATVQELSGGRLRLGVGVGWMDAEFRALGVPRRLRGRRSDEMLDFLHRAFADDRVTANGQEFLFLPRPSRPPIYVGGSGDHALRRAARWGDGWFPMGSDPAQLATSGALLREMCAEVGRPEPQILCFAGFDPRQPERAVEQVGALAGAGVSRIVAGVRYETEQEFSDHASFLAETVIPELERLARTRPEGA